MLPPIALGESDFRRLRDAGALYVDKTAGIARLLLDPTPVTLFLRPRRFGKTLWLTTLRAFLQRADHLGQDTTTMFASLAIWETPARRLHQRSPVMYLTLKDIKGNTWEEMLFRGLSHHDLGGDRPERVWQAFVIGMLLHAPASHQVLGNPEAGFGRADVVLVPRQAGRPGVIVELKRVVEEERLDAAVDAAAAQIIDRDYAARLREAGATPIFRYAVVFSRKRVRVQAV